MKLNQIALAVIALAAGSANAVDLAPTLVINLDGATALKKTVEDVAKYMCASHTGDVYYEGADKKISGVFCSAGMDASSGLAASTKLFLTKNNADGSLETFERALMRHAQTKVLDPANCDTTAKTCATKLVDAHGGFSDVDEKVAIGRGQFDPAAVVGGYTTKAGFAGQGFGIGVTTKLYLALQEQQFGAGSPCIGDTATDACMPSIAKQQFASILSATGGYKLDWSPILPAVFGSDTKTINLCRRVTTSGTQSSMDIHFLGFPCAKASPTFGALDSVRAADYPADGSNGMAVIENGGTGDVVNCLSRRNNNIDDTAFAKGVTHSNGDVANEWAIGVISLENTDGVKGTEGTVGDWHFVKLNNVNPREDVGQRQSVVDGRYDFAFEAVMAYRNDAPADAKTYLGKMTGLMGDPVKVAPLTGIFVVPGTSSHSLVPNRVHKGTQSGNSCQAFELFE